MERVPGELIVPINGGFKKLLFQSDVHAGSRCKPDEHFEAESFPFASDQVRNPGLTDADRRFDFGSGCVRDEWLWRQWVILKSQEGQSTSFQEEARDEGDDGGSEGRHHGHGAGEGLDGNGDTEEVFSPHFSSSGSAQSFERATARSQPRIIFWRRSDDRWGKNSRPIDQLAAISSWSFQ
jgi:hypothetical protein